MRCKICGREYNDKNKIVEWLGHRICIYCMGFSKERTKRGPPTPPKPKPPEEKPGIPPEYRPPPSIGPKEEKEVVEEEEFLEKGPPKAPPALPALEAPREKSLMEKIVDAIRSGVQAAIEAIREAVRRRESMEKRLHIDIALIQERIRTIIAKSLAYSPLFLTIQIKKLSTEDETILVEGEYNLLDVGKFCIELNKSTLEIKNMEIK